MNSYEVSEPIISNRIVVYKTDKRLIEFTDKLNASLTDNFAEMHGHCNDNGKTYSNIGIRLYDYSKGTGKNTVKVNVNVAPEDIYWIYATLNQGKKEFSLEQTKIFGSTDIQGFAGMTKLRIVRSETDQNGQKRKYQWCISAENGKGVPCKTAIGGTYCKSGTYKTVTKAFISISDYDFFKLICRVARYIQQFENAYCPSIIRQGHKAFEDMLMAKKYA